MAMAEEGGIIAWLFERNCLELLQEIFLYLDPESLHNSRKTCQGWNNFISESVWGSQRGHRALEKRLHNNWLTSNPRVFSVDYTEQMFFHHNKSALALDNKYLVAGLSHVGQGGAKVIDLATQEVLADLPYQDSQDRGVRSVMITQRAWRKPSCGAETPSRKSSPWICQSFRAWRLRVACSILLDTIIFPSLICGLSTS